MTSFNVDDLLETALADVEGPVALALSGGIDSMSVLFALLELDVDVRAYSFSLKGHQSTDFRIAREVCTTFNVPFSPVTLPTDFETMKRDVSYLTREVGVEGKADVECTWPFLYLLDAVDEATLATGACADGHFVISKKGMINYRDTVDGMDDYRDRLFTDPNYAQIQTLSTLATAHNIDEMRVPYYRDAFVETFKGTGWWEINKPNQKQPIIDAYPGYFQHVPVSEHTNLQLGDSRIAEAFTRFVDSDWNQSNYSTPLGVYNAIGRGDVGYHEPHPPSERDAETVRN